ncbi:MAG: hypothetical protein AAF512_03935 [Pseudomonadota bacterium]
MSIQELLNLIQGYPEYLLVYFCVPPVLAFFIGFLHGRQRGEATGWKYVYSVLVYLVCLPGIISLSLLAYNLFFIRGNLLEVNALVYFLPVASMILTLVIVAKQASINELPGFGKLSGLMVLLALTFAVLLFVYKTRILIGFFGSFEALLVLGVAVFLAFRWASRKLFS